MLDSDNRMRNEECLKFALIFSTSSHTKRVIGLWYSLVSNATNLTLTQFSYKMLWLK